MKNIISFVYAACALAAAVQCNAYGGDGSGGGSSSILNAQSYSMGASHGDYSPVSVPSPSYAPQSQSSKPRFVIQPLWSQEIYPGRNQYKSYHSAPHYSEVALPIVPSSPLAKLYISQSGGGCASSADGYGRS